MRALRMEWERIEAVTPSTLSPPATDPVWHRWQRPMRLTEMALTASHMAAWRRVVAEEEPCLVLEDDTFLSCAVPELLTLLSTQTDLDHVTLENRGRRKIISRNHDLAARPLRRLIQDRAGAAAYVLWPAGARKLLAVGVARPGPADATISACNNLISWQAYPALAVQLDYCTHYGIEPPLKTETSVHSSCPIDLSGYTKLARCKFRLRRVRAQIAMGLRLLAFAPISEKAAVPLAGVWPVVRP